MKHNLYTENQYIIDLQWQKINPQKQPKLNLPKTQLFITSLQLEHEKLHSSSKHNHNHSEKQLGEKVHNYILKYIQQKQLGKLGKEGKFLHEEEYTFDITDCLEIWRWLINDLNSSHQPAQVTEDFVDVNEFQVGKGLEPSLVLQQKAEWSKGKKIFGELSLEEQENVMKKSLEMVHMYKNQFKIIYKHYCTFTIQNEVKRTNTFDDVPSSLENLTINRFMLFCRQFDVLKMVEFKRKTEHNQSLCKQVLLTIFRKTAYLQKYMSLDSFLLALVSIGIKIHENVDPRSLIHIQLLLNALHVKYYHEFTAKLSSLGIKYSSSDFYSCYKNIIKKNHKKQMSQQKISMFNNPHFNDSQGTTSRYEPKVQDNQSIIKKYQSSNLLTKDFVIQQRSNQLQKRKSSLPTLPTIQNNKYFKPIQHNHHKNVYKKYLKESQDSSSVMKNRITGYSNINHLKHQSQPFHMNQQHEPVSKNTLSDLISDTKNKIHNIHRPSVENQHVSNPSNTSLAFSNPSSQVNNHPYKTMQDSKIMKHEETQYDQPEENNYGKPSSFSKFASENPLKSENNDINPEKYEKGHDKHENVPERQEEKIHEESAQNSSIPDKRKVIEELKQKVDLKDNDELLKKHQQAQERANNPQPITVQP